MRELKAVSIAMKSTVLTIFMLFFSVSFSNLAAAAIHPQAWFDIYNWGSTSCHADASPPKTLKTGRFRTFFVNTTSRPLRIGVWSVGKQSMRVNREIAVGGKVRWTVNDQFKFYVLDPFKRECVGAFQVSYADAGRSVDIMRGLDYERPAPASVEKKVVPKREMAPSVPGVVDEEVLISTDSFQKPKTDSVSRYESDRARPERPPVKKDPYGKLRRLAAELNGKRGRVNADFGLDSVRLDVINKNLIYRFSSFKPVKNLNTSVLRIANKSVYCGSSKLEPFREEGISSLWSYYDANKGVFEMRVTPDQCTP